MIEVIERKQVCENCSTCLYGPGATDLKDEKTRERNFDRCIAAKDAAQEVFKAAGRILWQHGTPQKDDEQLIAEDIWQVIRHQMYLDSGSTDTWRVDAREAIQWGPEPLPMIKRIEE